MRAGEKVPESIYMLAAVRTGTKLERSALGLCNAQFLEARKSQLCPCHLAKRFAGCQRDQSRFVNSWATRLRQWLNLSESEAGKPENPAEKMSNEIREGRAKILTTGKNDVFYNKAQVVNRDLSVAVIKTFIKKREEELQKGEKHMRARARKGKHESKKGANQQKDGPANGTKEDGDKPQAPGLQILEAMAASGLRAMRYALEIPEVSKVYANDIDPTAVAAMKKNIAHNGLEEGGKVVATESDARILMLQNPDTYDVIDLDPYGAPVTLLDSAVQSVCDGGLLCVTATDMAVLCGNSNEVCWNKYNSYPLKGKNCHESALRILLNSISSHASRYKKYIVPVLSLSVDFYVRVFVRVFVSPSQVKEAATKVSYVYRCNGCHSYYFQPVGKMEESGKPGGSRKFSAPIGPSVAKECENCGKRFKMGGPLWTKPIHDKGWIKDVLQMINKGGKAEFAIFDKVRGLLTVLDEELLDVPLSICLHDITRCLKCTPPPASDIRSAIANAGYRVSSTHTNPTGIKTDMPFPEFWDIMRCYVRDQPNASNLEEGSAGANIMAKAPSFEAKFARVFNALSKGKMNKIARFTPNPEAYWGPGTRAGKKPKPKGPKGQQGKKRKGVNGDNSAPKEKQVKTADNHGKTTETDNNNTNKET